MQTQVLGSKVVFLCTGSEGRAAHWKQQERSHRPACVQGGPHETSRGCGECRRTLLWEVPSLILVLLYDVHASPPLMPLTTVFCANTKEISN